MHSQQQKTYQKFQLILIFTTFSLLVLVGVIIVGNEFFHDFKKDFTGQDYYNYYIGIEQLNWSKKVAMMSVFAILALILCIFLIININPNTRCISKPLKLYFLVIVIFLIFCNAALLSNNCAELSSKRGYFKQVFIRYQYLQPDENILVVLDKFMDWSIAGAFFYWLGFIVANLVLIINLFRGQSQQQSEKEKENENQEELHKTQKNLAQQND